MFSCLLVCQPAIFVDSKRDGIRAAQRQKGLHEETYIQGEIAIRSYDSTGTTIEHYLGDAEEFYPDEHPQILEREVGYIFPLMEVEPTICIELKNEEDEG